MNRRTWKIHLLALSLLVAATAASAQGIRLETIDFGDLEARADEVVEVTLDRDTLRFAAGFLTEDSGDREIGALVKGLEGIWVRSFVFGKEGMYDARIVDRLRAQVGPSWKRIVNVRSKSSENVSIYALPDGERMRGIFIVAAEPKELTVVSISGPIDLEQISRLEGQFGIPKVTEEKKPAAARKKGGQS